MKCHSSLGCALLGLLTLGAWGSPLQAQPVFTVGINSPTPNTNSWPNTESPTNVRDGNPGTKYLNFIKLNAGFIETFPTTTVVNGIAFATANDGPERDPLRFSLYGSTTAAITGAEAPGTTFNLGTFTPILLDQLIAGFQTDPGRQFTVPNLAFANATAYRSYAVVFPTVRNAPAANSMQIGEVTFTNGGTPIAGQAVNPVLGGATAVPEPSSFALTCVAVGLAWRARRRAKR